MSSQIHDYHQALLKTLDVLYPDNFDLSQSETKNLESRDKETAEKKILSIGLICKKDPERLEVSDIEKFTAFFDTFTDPCFRDDQCVNLIHAILDMIICPLADVYRKQSELPSNTNLVLFSLDSFFTQNFLHHHRAGISDLIAECGKRDFGAYLIRKDLLERFQTPVDFASYLTEGCNNPDNMQNKLERILEDLTLVYKTKIFPSDINNWLKYGFFTVSGATICYINNLSNNDLEFQNISSKLLDLLNRYNLRVAELKEG